MTPIELLQNKLNEYEKSLHKSNIAFKNKLIPKEKNDLHKNSLIPKIKSYKEVINLLHKLNY